MIAGAGPGALDSPSPFAIPSGTSIATADREFWLAERAKGLGASEVADVCGFGRGSALGVFLRKTGKMPTPAETEAMGVGTLLEPAVLELYRRRTGRDPGAAQVFVHRPEYPRLFATVDAVMGGRPVEAKVVGHHAAREWGPEDDGADGVPFRVLLQATQQMLLLGDVEALDVAALLGTELRVYTVPFHATVAEFLATRAAEFLAQLDRGEAPPPAGPGDAGLIPYLHPGAAGEIELTGTAAEDASEFLRLGDIVRDAEATRKACKARLDLALAGASTGRLPDGRALSRRVVVQAAGERVTRLEAKSWSVIQLKRGKGAERGTDE